MKVLMIARKTLNTSPGGDTVQINSTAKYLRFLGVEVDVRLSSEVIQYSDYDLMHFFNIIRPDDILPHLDLTSLPYFISTIFVDYTEYEKNNRKGLLKVITKIFNGDQLEYLKSIARMVKNGDKINSMYYLLHGHKASIRHVAEKAKMLLPNSHSEYDRFVTSYEVEAPYRKVPNAIDPSVFNKDTVANSDYTDHVLCVGRIEGRKNQLNLIKALYDTDLKLTLIGKPSPNHMEYFQECMDLIAKNKNMKIIEHLNHSELSAIYKAAKVHVLPSWFETTGLSSLEAAMMDCNVVVSDKGDTKEYFEDYAWYCDPDDVPSIKSAVLKAFESPVLPALKEKILSDYTWENAARETLNAYKSILTTT